MVGRAGTRAAVHRDSATPWYGLTGALAAATLLRCAWALWVPVVPVSDSAIYREFAQSIVQGRGYAFVNGDLTVYWAVGTSAVYAALQMVFGESLLPILVLNLLLGAGVVWLTHTLAAQLFDARTANVSAWIIALWPLLIQFTTVLASELLFIFMVLAALVAWFAMPGRPLTRGGVFGALMCGAAYVRPIALPLIVLVPAAQVLLDSRLRDNLVSCVAALLITAACLAPWAWRNQQLFGQPVLVSANFGANLWMGNNPASRGGYIDLPDRGLGNEVQRDQAFKREALAYIASDPLGYLRRCAFRIWDSFNRETIGVAWNSVGLERAGATHLAFGLKAGSSLYWLSMLALAIGGVALALRRRTIAWLHPMNLSLALFASIPILTVSQDRYHMPIIPFVAIFAAVALVSVTQARRGRT